MFENRNKPPHNTSFVLIEKSVPMPVIVQMRAEKKGKVLGIHLQ